MNFDYQQKQNFQKITHSPTTPKDIYSPQLSNNEYDGDLEEYRFYKGKDINIYRLWFNKYNKHITWKEFQEVNSHFDINNPAEGQLVKVPKIINQEKGKKSIPEAKKEIQQNKKQEIPKKVLESQTIKASTTRVQTPKKEFIVKNGLIVLNNEKNNWHPPKIAIKDNPKYSEIFFNALQSTQKASSSELDLLMKKEELSVEEIAKARILIEKIKDDTKKGDYFEELQYKVPYYNQRNSEFSNSIADGMCNMSSMAMAMSLFGVENPNPEMQYDDALEKIRSDNNYGDRTSSGQFNVAKHFEFYFGGIKGTKKDPLDNTWLGGDAISYSYDWYEKNVIPELRKGNSITLGIWDNFGNGHIVHLLGVSKEGLWVHDPYAKTDWGGANYSQVMHNQANTRDNKSQKGKKIVWKFDDLKNTKSGVYLAYIRILKK